MNPADVFNISLIFALIGVAIVVAAIVWLLYKAGSLPHPAPIVTSLTILSLVAIVGGIATEQTALIALAGTGVGALAGAVAGIYSDKPPMQDNDRKPVAKEETDDDTA